jgi:hypothetical protein
MVICYLLKIGGEVFAVDWAERQHCQIEYPRFIQPTLTFGLTSHPITPDIPVHLPPSNKAKDPFAQTSLQIDVRLKNRFSNPKDSDTLF